MTELLAVYKPVGMTPYELIQRIKEAFPHYREQKIGYAGRLDPLAHGVMLLMIGEATKERERYLDLDKAYTFEAIFGITTDTYDLLGIVQNRILQPTPNDLSSKINSFVKTKLGTQQQPYPPYSSKAVHGKPLHWWAKEQRLAEITIPTHLVVINQFALVKLGEISREDVQTKVASSIDSVQGDFRQEAIKKQWNKFFQTNNFSSLPTATFQMECSSGTYVRSLVHELGISLGSGAVTSEILRTKVGEYTLDKAITL